WNLVGVCDELLLREDGVAEFDVFMRIGDAESTRDFAVELQIRDVSNSDTIASYLAPRRATSDGVATSVFELAVEFPREDVYDVEVVVEGRLLDVQKLPVLFVF